MIWNDRIAASCVALLISSKCAGLGEGGSLWGRSTGQGQTLCSVACKLHSYWCTCWNTFVSDNVPEELKDPFYIDQYEQEHIKPPVIKLLLSSELYCRVCSLILKGDQVAALQGHQSVTQALSRKGIYVMESDDTPVSESDLGCAPIKMVSLIKST